MSTGWRDGSSIMSMITATLGKDNLECCLSIRKAIKEERTHNFIFIRSVEYLPSSNCLSTILLFFLFCFKGDLRFHVDHTTLDKNPKRLWTWGYNITRRFDHSDGFRSGRRPKFSAPLCRLNLVNGRVNQAKKDCLQVKESRILCSRWT